MSKGQTDRFDTRNQQQDNRAESDKRKNRSRKNRNGPNAHRSQTLNAEPQNTQLPVLEIPGNPLILSRNQHTVSRKHIDADALKVMYRLNRTGHHAFLVGGGVRDLLLGKKPKDFDIATDASPEQVRSLFRNSRIIGRRFRINHVYFYGNKIYEVATFRKDEASIANENGLLVKSDNVFGDAQTDALRRDLTINGLFYDLSTFSVIDYVGGINDLKQGIIRIIGEPEKRIREDPVRMIRAIRHAARTGFKIEPNTYNAIINLRDLIDLSSKPRVHEEVLRELRGGYALASVRLLDQTGLLPHLLPLVAQALLERKEESWAQLELALTEVDRISRTGVELLPSLVFLAIAIGLLPSAELDKKRSTCDSRILRDLWLSSPEFLIEDQVFIDSSDISNLSTEGVLADYSRKSLVGPLRKMITEVFQSLGVSKREKERMESLIFTRYELILASRGKIKSALVETKEYFHESLDLLRMTAGDEIAKNACRYWEDRIGKIKDADHGGGRRRRSRSRRRRRSGSGSGTRLGFQGNQSN